MNHLNIICIQISMNSEDILDINRLLYPCSTASSFIIMMSTDDRLIQE